MKCRCCSSTTVRWSKSLCTMGQEVQNLKSEMENLSLAAMTDQLTRCTIAVPMNWVFKIKSTYPKITKPVAVFYWSISIILKPLTTPMVTTGDKVLAYVALALKQCARGWFCGAPWRRRIWWSYLTPIFTMHYKWLKIYGNVSLSAALTIGKTKTFSWRDYCFDWSRFIAARRRCRNPIQSRRQRAVSPRPKAVTAWGEENR